jgi:hypothetical protein
MLATTDTQKDGNASFGIETISAQLNSNRIEGRTYWRQQQTVVVGRISDATSPLASFLFFFPKKEELK